MRVENLSVWLPLWVILGEVSLSLVQGMIFGDSWRSTLGWLGPFFHLKTTAIEKISFLLSFIYLRNMSPDCCWLWILQEREYWYESKLLHFCFSIYSSLSLGSFIPLCNPLFNFSFLIAYFLNNPDFPYLETQWSVYRFWHAIPVFSTIPLALSCDCCAWVWNSHGSLSLDNEPQISSEWWRWGLRSDSMLVGV